VSISPATSGGRAATAAALCAAVAALAGSAVPAEAIGRSPAAQASTIPVGGFPTGIAVDPTTDTVYVGNGTTNTVSVIDGATCNARDGSGCGRLVAAATGGLDPIGIGVDGSSNTVYVVNFSGTVALLDGARCDASDTAGCHQRPPTVRVGASPQFLAVDEQTHTVYVANSNTDTVSVIDGRACRPGAPQPCAHVRATVPVGLGPFTLADDEATDTVYVTVPGTNTVAVIDGKTCNAAVTTGCRRPAATVAVGQTPGGIAVDAATDTVYVTGETSNAVSVIDGATCNGSVTSGCEHTAATVLAGAGARGIAVDQTTDTVYVANTAANTVSVIDGATCNAEVRGGCGQHAYAAPVGLSPRRVAIDEQTNTIYVTNAGSDSVTIIDGSSCDGATHRGCGRPAASQGLTA
jgi:DNA-binding beta-propeller fold protein YncE